MTGLPHARGGVSGHCRAGTDGMASSPRSWGCFCVILDFRVHFPVFPTLVGVFLDSYTWLRDLMGLPHARGGVSDLIRGVNRIVRSSPRSWGCFSLRRRVTSVDLVFPTLVGVFLEVTDGADLSPSLPHARGGVSGHGH